MQQTSAPEIVRSAEAPPRRWKLVVSILLCEGAGILGIPFTLAGMHGWYQALQKPALNPPGWIFGPVWTVLFFLMGIALYLVWNRTQLQKQETRAMTWFFVQLALNILWTFFFFFLRAPALAFFEIILLWLAIAVTIYHFWRVSVVAGLLLIPYLAWVSFATYLNFMLWRLNF